MNIYKKLIEVRKTVPYLKQDNQGHQFKFVSSSQTLGTIRGKLDELGLLLIPRVVSHEVRDHATKKGGHEYFTNIVINFTWVNSENPDETIECGWIGQGLDSGEKGVGKALTYAEKYFILKFFNIATDKDDPDSFQKRVEQKKPENIDERFSKAIDYISSFAKNGSSVEAFENRMDVTDFSMFKGKHRQDIETTIDDIRKHLEEARE